MAHCHSYLNLNQNGIIAWDCATNCDGFWKGFLESLLESNKTKMYNCSNLKVMFC